MNDDLHYGVQPINLGSFAGANRPIDINHETRGYGWGLFSIFMLAANLSLIIFAVWGWR